MGNLGRYCGVYKNGCSLVDAVFQYMQQVLISIAQASSAD
jgi:hypothetical protein